MSTSSCILLDETFPLRDFTPPYFWVLFVWALRGGSTLSTPRRQLRSLGRRQEGQTEAKGYQDAPVGAQLEPRGADPCRGNWNQTQVGGEDKRCPATIELDLKFVPGLPLCPENG